MDDIEALILCRTRADAGEAAVEQALHDATKDLAGTGLAMILPPSALPALAHVDASQGALPDAIVTIRSAEGDLKSHVGHAVARLARVIDLARSSILVSRRHAILPGDDAVRLVFGIRRLARLTLDGFHDYWLNRHAALGRRLIPPYTYHQLHASPRETEALAKASGLPASTLDGIAEVHFPDIDAFVRQLSRPEVAEEALADERNFIDHDRSIFWAYRTL